MHCCCGLWWIFRGEVFGSFQRKGDEEKRVDVEVATCKVVRLRKLICCYSHVINEVLYLRVQIKVLFVI